MVSNLVEREVSKERSPSVEHLTKETMQTSSSEPSNKRAGSFVYIAIAALIASTAFGAGWWFATNQAHDQTRIALPPSDHTVNKNEIIVTAAPMTYRPVQRYVEAVGSLHGFEEITISSKQEGRVLKIHHDLSSVVQPGDLLLDLDPTDAKLAFDQAERAVQTELAKWGFTTVPSETDDLKQLPTVVSARLKYELAQSRLDRMIPLQATNSVSAEDLEQAKSDALVMKSDWQNQLLMANSAAATARLRSADLAIANQRMQDISIRAPIPTLTAIQSDQFYTISERMVSEGTLVRPGTEVFKLVLGRTLKLRLAVPEAFSTQVVVGQSVSVISGALEKPSAGTVARISPAIDRATRTFIVEVDVPNQDGLLKPGGFAKAKILIGTDAKAATIPLSGLYSFAGINKLFLHEQGVAREFKVTLGEQTDNWVEITSPVLPDSAIVITSGQRLLSDGIAVFVREPEMATEPAKDNVTSEVAQ